MKKTGMMLFLFFGISVLGYAQNSNGEKSNKAPKKSLSDTLKIAEVVVTAQETRGVTTASVIEKHAMEHLQPSSFSDILELLPGGRSKTLPSTPLIPSVSARRVLPAAIIHLRWAPAS